MLSLLIFLGLTAFAYAAYRWHRARVIAEQKLHERQQRHREQEEAWERMLADMASKRHGERGSPPIGT